MIFIVLAMNKYNNAPDALVPLGHQPVIMIIINSILEYDKDAFIYILVLDRFTSIFCTEIRRWVGINDKVIIVPVDTTLYMDALKTFIKTRSIKETEDLIIWEAVYPLISSSTLSAFIEKTNQHLKPSMLVAKTKDTTTFSHIVIQDNIVYSGIMRCNPNTTTSDWFSGKGKHLCFMDVSSVSKECLPVHTDEDRLYAEHTHLENKHTLFLHQCYSLWRKCLTLENRIDRIEDAKILKNKI
jgi:hypothetical protein